MIDLYYAGTPNGMKMKLFFEETGLAHRVIRVDLGKGDQFAPAFLAISPNNKIPAIVDHGPADGGAPIVMFESGAILLYLAEKTGKLIPADERDRLEARQWLFWQMAGLGPLSGQAGHFRAHAAERVPYAIARYTKEVARLYGVLDRRLDGRSFIVGGDYSIVDIACYPWIFPHEGLGQDLADFPNLARWFRAVESRPATRRAYEGVKNPYAKGVQLSAEERAVLFGGGGPKSA